MRLVFAVVRGALCGALVLVLGVFLYRSYILYASGASLTAVPLPDMLLDVMAIHPNLHDQDFYAWALGNAALLRDGRLSEIDIEHVAEELETMGRSERREFVSHLAILFAHLLKWANQSGRQSSSWRNTIKVQRLDTSGVLADNPSLQAQADDIVSAAYEKSKLLAANETGFDERRFPDQCPWTLEQALDPDYWPDQAV